MVVRFASCQQLGLRPFGVSFLFAGYDKIYGFQLYHSDPSGNYAGWKATCIGANSSNAQTILKQDLEKDKTLDLKEATALAIKVLNKTMDSTTLGSDKCNLFYSLIDSGICNLVFGRIGKTSLPSFFGY